MFPGEILQYMMVIYHTFGELSVFENHLRNLRISETKNTMIDKGKLNTCSYFK